MYGFMAALAMVCAPFVGYAPPSPTSLVDTAVPYQVVRCVGPDGYGFTYAGTDGNVVNSGTCRPAVFNVVCDGPSAYGVSWDIAEQWAQSVGTCVTTEVR